MLRLGITQRIYKYEPYNELWECLDSALYGYFDNCLCVGLSCMGGREMAQAYARECDIIVLSGGNDIGEYPMRDDFELALIESALTYQKKILGICRGAQMLARYFGVGLGRSAHGIKQAHRLNGWLHHSVHSYHRFCIESLPPNCVELARADNELEAFASERILGLMWHIEREWEAESVRADRELVGAFLSTSWEAYLKQGGADVSIYHA